MAVSAAPFVVALTATFRRPMELRRLVDSIAKLTQPLGAWVVVDNAGDVDFAALEKIAGCPVVALKPETNLGCGGGLRAGEELALARFAAELTHLWILDDDAVLEPDALALMLAALSSEGAVAAYPMVLDAKGHLDWVPGLIPRARMMALKEPHTAAQFAERWGLGTLGFSWAQGVALLVAREALEKCGLHRTDYWVRGEDLEFSLRLTAFGRGVFVPAARVAHLPPEMPAQVGQTGGEYEKTLAHLQNLSYTTLRLPHGRRVARTLPGNWLRFFRLWGRSPRRVWDSLRAVWKGAVLGHPAGVGR